MGLSLVRPSLTMCVQIEMWHLCPDWNCDQREPKRKPSKQSRQLQFPIKLSTVTIMSSSQQNQRSHLAHVIILFWGENLRPGCDFSIKASGLSGLVCVLEPEIERRISTVMTCLCPCKKGSVSLLSMNCVLLHIPTELSLWDYTHTHPTEMHTIRQNPDSAWLIHMLLFFTHPTYTHPLAVYLFALFLNNSGNLTPWMRVCVCVFLCVTEVSSCMVIKSENGRLLRLATPSAPPPPAQTKSCLATCWERGWD